MSTGSLMLSRMVQGASTRRLVVSPFEVKESGGRLELMRAAKPFAVKASPDAAAEGQIDGYGAIFNDPHPTSSWALDYDWQDSISPGAFSKTLAEHKSRGTTPLMLYMHERGNIPGAWRSITEDKTGLAVTGQVSKSAVSPSGVPTYELLKMGALNGLSIGFCVTKAMLDEETKVRTILELELGEVSIVDIPGGPSARITDVKAGNPRDIQFLETVLRDAGLSRKEAKAVLAEGFNALRDAAANDPRISATLTDAAGSKTPTPDLAGLFRGFAQAIRPK